MPVEFVTRQTLPLKLEAFSRSGGPSVDEVVSSRTGGLPVPRFAGKTIHSSYDPIDEARRFVDAFRRQVDARQGEAVAVLGNGFGYVAEALLEAGLKPVVFEPVRALLAGMAAHRDVPAFLDRVPLFLIDDPAELFRAGEHKALLAGVKAVLPLPYLSWLFPAFADDFRNKCAAIASARDACYKVSVVSPIYGGAVETARHAAAGLQANGMAVDFVDVSPFGAILNPLRAFHATHARKGSEGGFDAGVSTFLAWASSQVAARVAAFDPAIVVVLPDAPVGADQLRAFREQGRRVVTWFVEDRHLLRRWESEAASYDLFLPIQKGDFPKALATAGQAHHHYLPLAADCSVFAPMVLEVRDRRDFGSPISFMGAAYYNRIRFFQALASKPFRIWGTGWPADGPLAPLVQEGGRRLTAPETAKIFNATDVNVNLHSSVSHEGINPFGDFVNPRTFEIAACAAFQLVDRRSLLPGLFEPGVEVECFSDRVEFDALLDVYLADPESRRSMAEKARNRVLREHTYPQRMRELLEAVHEHCPPDPGRKIPTARALAEESADPDWKSMLRGLDAEALVDFDRLHRHVIRGNPGHPLTKLETMVLMLGELRHGGR
ncbi:MAG TPA: glycosyltransferase [Candidatus Deferrimicrobiaceae bacterium]